MVPFKCEHNWENCPASNVITRVKATIENAERGKLSSFGKYELYVTITATPTDNEKRTIAPLRII